MGIFFLSMGILLAAKAYPQSQTTYDKDRHTYTTTGEKILGVGLADAAKIASSFATYNSWLFSGINGEKGNKRKLICILKELNYQRIKDSHRMTLIFDVDLFFPLGREDASLHFAITGIRKKGAKLTGYSLLLSEKSLIIDSILFRVDLKAIGPKQSKLTYYSALRLKYLFDMFFNLERYKRNISWRIEKIISNFEKRVRDLYPP